MTRTGPARAIGALALAAALVAGCAATSPPGPAGSSAQAPATASAPSGEASGAASSAASGRMPPRPPRSTSAAPSEDWRRGPTVEGTDVSAWNPRVDWRALHANGLRFAWIKATEGTGWTSSTFAGQRSGAQAAGLLTGGYHYARPASSDGASQARHFLAHGGGWWSDGRTLPGALDLEAAEKGDPCHGLSRERLTRWVRDFAETYAAATGRHPVLYVKNEIATRCLTTDLPDLDLWLYDHDGAVGPWPDQWSRPTIWQRGVVDGLDRNVWFGTEADLRAWAAQVPG